jgi:hypothetical protein
MKRNIAANKNAQLLIEVEENKRKSNMKTHSYAFKIFQKKRKEKKV